MYCTTLSYLDSILNPALIRSPVTPQHTFTRTLSCHTAHDEHTDTHAQKNTEHGFITAQRQRPLLQSFTPSSCLFLICCNTIEVCSYLREESVFLGACPLHRPLHKPIKSSVSELKVCQQNYLLFQSKLYHSLVSRELRLCVSQWDMKPLLKKLDVHPFK